MSDTRISASPSQFCVQPEINPIGTPISSATPTATLAITIVMRAPNRMRL
jgi:hypothetical protein